MDRDPASILDIVLACRRLRRFVGGRVVPTLDEVKAEPDRAMAALRRMMAEGVLPLASLRSDPDLALLRTRPDFPLLIMDLAMPAHPFAP